MQFFFFLLALYLSKHTIDVGWLAIQIVHASAFLINFGAHMDMVFIVQV